MNERFLKVYISKPFIALVLVTTILAGCSNTNPKNLLNVQSSNFHKEITKYDGKEVCLTGKAQVGWHGVVFETNYSGIILPYAGNVYLPISYEEALALDLRTGDTYRFCGRLEIRQSKTKCTEGQCYTYYLSILE